MRSIVGVAPRCPKQYTLPIMKSRGTPLYVYIYIYLRFNSVLPEWSNSASCSLACAFRLHQVMRSNPIYLDWVDLFGQHFYVARQNGMRTTFILKQYLCCHHYKGQSPAFFPINILIWSSSERLCDAYYYLKHNDCMR
jgi:hypothetical protein